MTPQELKNSILQLAIQGKLVEQRAEEGTAEELYQQILFEKQRLIKEGTIKKEKLLPEITADEKPFDIPGNWILMQLLDITYAVGNRNNQILSKEVKPQGMYPAVSQGAKLIDGYSDLENKLVNDLPLIMFGDHTRNVKFINFPFVISADGSKFMKTIIIEAKYLFYWMTHTAEHLRNRGYARHFTLLVKKLVPIPPLAEQKRIVAKIEELLPHIDCYEQAWSKLEGYNKNFPGDMQKSILQMAIQGKLAEQRAEEGTGEELYQQIKAEKHRLFKAGTIKKEIPLPEITEDEKPFDIPESWKWVRVGSITTLNPKNVLDDNLDVAFIPMPCVSDGFRNQHTFEVRKWKEIKKGFTHFTNGDIGVAKITPCFQNRKSVIFSKLENGYGAGTTELSIVRVIENKLDRDYLLWFFKTEHFIVNGIKSFSGTAGQQRIYKDYLANCLIPLPPIAEQQRIVAKTEELLFLCEKLQKVKSERLSYGTWQKNEETC